MFKGQTLALTFDGWTSKANKAYNGYHVSWIDEAFELRSVALGIFPFPGEHASVRILDNLREVLERRGIEISQVAFKVLFHFSLCGTVLAE
jgi:hypothetical protein